MKVVDEKGKLFGKLNIIDLLVIIFIIAAVAVVGIKVLGGTGAEGDSEPEARLTYTVRVTAQNKELAKRMADYVDITKGKRDQLMSNGNMVDAYIIDYDIEPCSYNWIGDGTVEIYDAEAAEEAGLVDIVFVIEANIEDALLNGVGSQEVRIGKSHTVKTIHIEFTNGVVEDCTWEMLKPAEPAE